MSHRNGPSRSRTGQRLLARSEHGSTLNFNGPDGYLFVYNFLNLSDLLLNLSSRLFDVAFGFEFRIAGHFACCRFDSTLYLMCRTLNFVFGTCVHFVPPLLRLTGMGQHFCCELLSGRQFTHKLRDKARSSKCRNSSRILSDLYCSCLHLIASAFAAQCLWSARRILYQEYRKTNLQ
jgi:hypothetical protein